MGRCFQPPALHGRCLTQQRHTRGSSFLLHQWIRTELRHPHNLKVVGSNPTPATIRHARCGRADARGLEVSVGGLGQDQLVERQIRHRPAQPAVLKLPVLQPLRLFTCERDFQMLSPIMIRRSSSTRVTYPPTTIAASPIFSRRISTVRSPTWIPWSGSGRHPHPPTTIAVASISPSRTMTARSPITTRRFGSIPITPPRSTGAARRSSSRAILPAAMPTSAPRRSSIPTCRRGHEPAMPVRI